jgi:SAM-dependent methyltransferase
VKIELGFLAKNTRRFVKCIHGARLLHFNRRLTLPYPVLIRPRNINTESTLPGGGPETFDKPEAIEINHARLAHLASLEIPIEGKTVLDVGCGVGHLAQFFVDKGCRVVCVDGRSENISRLHQLYPNLEAYVANVETEPLARFGIFDIVFAYGLLYHLENPVAALRNIASVCQWLLLLETIVSDHVVPILRIEDESGAFSQGLKGLGCRPSPSYIVVAINRVGFPFVYAPQKPPEHPDFQFEWENNLEWRRNGRNLRCIFVASKRELKNPYLINLLRA